MPDSLISHSRDLRRLRDDGYEVEIKANHLILENVPYVNSQRQVKRGALVSVLSLAGDQTTRPSTHIAMFTGEHPCDQNGQLIEAIRYVSGHQALGPGLNIDHQFSSKPRVGFYADYYEKMSTYADIISGPAEALEPGATARTFRVIECDDPESPFRYMDTASTRAGIGSVTQKLAVERVALVGLGGTGSYVLDLVAKTPVGKIRLYDGDIYGQHNAFRSPGAPSIDELRELPFKVDHFKGIYSRMHRGIIARPVFVDASNVEELRDMDFVFLCLDAGHEKYLIVQALEAYGVPFVDVGMGVDLVDGSLLGTLRVTTSTPAKRDHVHDGRRISFSGDGGADLYATNIQVADLNAMNAALAVIKWKKLTGFYVDLEREHFTTFNTDGNQVLNEDCA